METQYNKTTNPPPEKSGSNFGGGRSARRYNCRNRRHPAAWQEQVGADLPYWLFSWPMILIALGLYIGARHSFRQWGWLIPVAIGTIFLLDDIIPDINTESLHGQSS